MKMEVEDVLAGLRAGVLAEVDSRRTEAFTHQDPETVRELDDLGELMRLDVPDISPVVPWDDQGMALGRRRLAEEGDGIAFGGHDFLVEAALDDRAERAVGHARTG